MISLPEPPRTPPRVTRSLSPTKETFSPKKNNLFGHGSMSPSKNQTSSEVREVYHLIEKATGFIGGNAYNSAMYGELTKGSMQSVCCNLYLHQLL